MFFKTLLSTGDPKLAKDVTRVSESFKNIRANLMFALAGTKDKCKIILFTSSEQGDGKSTNCINVAAAYADSNARVLVIDADLRRPKIARYTNCDNKSTGLSDYLGGFCQLEDVIVRPEGCNFDCIFSGRIPPNPSELLMIDEVENMIKTLSERYDYIFLDTPPVGVVSETIYLTQFVTGVVVVIKKNSSHFKSVQEAMTLLEFAKANILGFVFNDAFDAKNKKYYYKKRRYYYYE